MAPGCEGGDVEGGGAFTETGGRTAACERPGALVTVCGAGGGGALGGAGGRGGGPLGGRGTTIPPPLTPALPTPSEGCRCSLRPAPVVSGSSSLDDTQELEDELLIRATGPWLTPPAEDSLVRGCSTVWKVSLVCVDGRKTCS